jgi:hypothetical protein
MGSRLHSTESEQMVEQLDEEFDVVCVVDVEPEFNRSATQLWIWDERTDVEISKALGEVMSEVYELQDQ